MIEQQSLSEKAVNTEDLVLATKVGIIGLALQFILYVSQMTFIALRIGAFDETMGLSIANWTWLLYPLNFIAGVLVSVGFVGLFGLNRRGTVGLLYFFGFFVLHYIQVYGEIMAIIRDILPMDPSILFIVPLLAIVNRVKNKRLLLAVILFFVSVYFVFPLFLPFLWSLEPPSTPLEFMLQNLPVFIIYFVFQLMLIAIFYDESKWKPKNYTSDEVLNA